MAIKHLAEHTDLGACMPRTLQNPVPIAEALAKILQGAGKGENEFGIERTG